MTKRVLVCGDREWTDFDLIFYTLSAYSTDTVIIEGEARGADRLARAAAEELGFKVRGFPADWDSFGKAAGPIRNQEMLDRGKPDEVIAFHDNLESSRGTADMIRRAEKAGIPVRKVRHG